MKNHQEDRFRGQLKEHKKKEEVKKRQNLHNPP
jgi:hypothetical protein